jgi:hypothetical protein
MFFGGKSPFFVFRILMPSDILNGNKAGPRLQERYFVKNFYLDVHIWMAVLIDRAL